MSCRALFSVLIAFAGMGVAVASPGVQQGRPAVVPLARVIKPAVVKAASIATLRPSGARFAPSLPRQVPAANAVTLKPASAARHLVAAGTAP